MTRRPRGGGHGGLDAGGDRGAAVAELVLVLGLVLLVFLSVLQVAVWYHVRNVVVASAAEGARYGAVAGRDPGTAEVRTREVLAGALSDGYAAELRPRASVEVDPASGARLVVVRVTGPGPVFLRAFGGLLRLDVRGRSLQEPR